MIMSETDKVGKKTAIEILTAPLTADEIEWRVQASKNGKTLIAPYIDNRAVMSRFDRAFGPMGWQNAFHAVPLEDGEGKGGRTPSNGEALNLAWLCGIGVRAEGGEWIWKWDGAGSSDLEPVKGGLSNAMKRAATQWGVGRELYSYPRVYIMGEHRYVPFEVLRRLEGLPAAVAAGKRLPEVIQLNPDGSETKKAA